MIWGKIEGRRRSGQQSMRWLDNITDSMDMNVITLQETEEDRVRRAIVYGVGKSLTGLSS